MKQKGRQYFFEYNGQELITRMFGCEYLEKNAIIDAKNFIKKHKLKFEKDKLVLKYYKDFEFDDDKIKSHTELSEYLKKMFKY